MYGCFFYQPAKTSKTKANSEFLSQTCTKQPYHVCIGKCLRCDGAVKSDRSDWVQVNEWFIELSESPETGRCLVTLVRQPTAIRPETKVDVQTHMMERNVGVVWTLMFILII